MNNSSKKIKYAALCFNTENIGDEIQSLAAQRFLPRIDYYVDRDHLDDLPQKKDEEIKLILNSWFLSPSQKDGSIHWPPKSAPLNPLLISMHTSFLNGSTKTFSSPTSRSFLNKFAPVGARDLATQSFFQSIGVPSFFSGCLTLTLLPDPSIKKQDYILAVDISDTLFCEIKKRTNRRIIRLDTTHPLDIDNQTRFKLAKYWLYLYQSAHCVVSSRLHAMLPCLSLKTPVIGVSGRDVERFSGLIDLVNHYSEKEILQNKRISFDNPPDNPKSFEKIRKKLIVECKKYTNYDSKQSFLLGTDIVDLLSDEDLISLFTKSINDNYSYGLELKNQLEQYEQNYKNFRLEVEKHIQKEQNLEQELKECKTLLENPGIKTSVKNLKKALKNYAKKMTSRN